MYLLSGGQITVTHPTMVTTMVHSSGHGVDDTLVSVAIGSHKLVGVYVAVIWSGGVGAINCH